MAEWLEAAAVIRKAASQLAVGEMVHVRHFQLAEAISAVEIGDPRMDFPLDESLQVGALIANGKMPLGEPLPSQLAVVDGLICRLAQWWSGYTLLQTVYTSLYMLAPDRLVDEPFLGPICAAMIAIISVCKSLILGGMVVEEEDCPIFSPGVPEEPAPCKEQTEHLTTLLSNALNKCSSSEQTPNDALEAMQQRLSFLKHLLLGLLEVQQKVSASACRRARIHFVAAQEALASMRASAKVAAPEEPVSFVPKLHLSAWALPPPPVKPLPTEAAFDMLAKALTALVAACAVTDVTTLPGLKSFLAQFLDGSIPGVARAALHTQLSTRDTAADDEISPWAPSVHMIMRDMFLTPALVHKAEDVRVFLEQAQLATSNFIQALCMNKSRVRRRLRARLEDYANLYTHALNGDACAEMSDFLSTSGWTWPADPGPNLPAGPCTMWVERESCASMLEHLLLGFELGLYSVHEYVMVYWYSDYLLSVLGNATRNFVRFRPKEFKHSPKKKGRAKGDSLLTPGEIQRVGKEQLTLSTLEMRRFLCQGMLRLTVALDRAGLCSAPDYTFGEARHRFEQRFESFQNIVAPPALGHDSFVRSTDASDLSVMQLLELPLESFKRASDVGQEVLEAASRQQGALSDWEASDVRACCAVGKRNWFACNILLKTFKAGKEKSLAVEWDFSSHKHFPTLTLKTS